MNESPQLRVLKGVHHPLVLNRLESCCYVTHPSFCPLNNSRNPFHHTVWTPRKMLRGVGSFWNAALLSPSVRPHSRPIRPRSTKRAADPRQPGDPERATHPEPQQQSERREAPNAPNRQAIARGLALGRSTRSAGAVSGVLNRIGLRWSRPMPSSGDRWSKRPPATHLQTTGPNRGPLEVVKTDGCPSKIHCVAWTFSHCYRFKAKSSTESSTEADF